MTTRKSPLRVLYHLLGSGNPNYDCTPQSLGRDPQYPANCQWPGIHAVKGEKNRRKNV